MTTPESSDDEKALRLRESVPKVTTELNNLLQIIAGTSALIENIWEGNNGSEKYFAMLRASVERAEKVTAELVEQAGGSDKRMLVHPDLAAFSKTRVAPQPSDSPKHRILLVDDEEMTLTLVKRLLTEAGFHVVTALSGFECLDLFHRKPRDFDLVLLDLTMPFMDGEETFRRLHAIRPGMPVVLTTGFIEEIKLNDLLEDGLAGFLRKPQSPDEIINCVRGILENVRCSRLTHEAESVPTTA